MMTLDDALADIAHRFGLDTEELIQYSYEDEHSGWDKGVGEWPVGSLWTVEGRVLYALTRALKPDTVFEIGTNVGCSTTHFASALKANGHGTVLSFDTAETIQIPGLTQTYSQGELIPVHVREHVELIHGDGLVHLEQYIGTAGIIYEDCDHSTESTQRAWTVGRQKLVTGGVIISHDAAHWLVGEAIRQGITNAGMEATIYAIRPSDCGLAIWRKPMHRQEPVGAVEPAVPEHLQPFIPADKPGIQLHVEPDFDSMTLKELKEYADENTIALGSARTKAKIIAVLRED
jgi:predicted O-methyltransferase YrrM